MASSKLIKRWIKDTKKTAARLDKELKEAKEQIKKFQGDLKTDVLKEKAAAVKKPVEKKK